jgi:uncharacterized protein HemY
MAQMEALNQTVQSFRPRAPLRKDPQELQKLREAQKHFQDATHALKAGDYKKAEVELRRRIEPANRDAGERSTCAISRTRRRASRSRLRSR